MLNYPNPKYLNNQRASWAENLGPANDLPLLYPTPPHSSSESANVPSLHLLVISLADDRLLQVGCTSVCGDMKFFRD